MGWSGVKWDGAEPIPHLAAPRQPLGSGERRESGPAHQEGRGAGAAPGPGLGGAPGGEEAAGSAREGAGLSGVSAVPAAVPGGAGPRGCSGLCAPVRAGRSRLGRRLERVGVRRGLLDVPGDRAGSRAGGAPARPSTAPGRGSALWFPRGSGAAPAPLAVPRSARSPRGRARSSRRRPDPPLPRSPSSSPACPGPCPLPRPCSGPPRPRSPRAAAGEEAGLGRWADADQER